MKPKQKIKQEDKPKSYEFIDKALFFKEQGIVVIGDLHLGFEESLRQSGVLVPERQIKDIIQNLKEIFERIEKLKIGKINKIVFLGDIKHAFYFEKEELKGFNQIMEFLQNRFDDKDILLVKGNHDTMDFSLEKKMRDYHVEKRILFIHGHEQVNQSVLKRADTIVMGHTHPCVILHEGSKKEVYKCFLEGQYNGRKIIVLPSFMDITEGTPVNYYDEDYMEDFSFIPKKKIMKFKIYAVGEKEVLEFGRIKDLR